MRDKTVDINTQKMVDDPLSSFGNGSQLDLSGSWAYVKIENNDNSLRISENEVLSNSPLGKAKIPHEVTIEQEESPETKDTTVFDVAAYILTKIGSISTIKLQKLVYYSQAWSLVWDDKPLFHERIEAWVNGPVVPDLFYLHKGLFSIDKDLIPVGNHRKLSEEQRITVDAVLEYYGDKSAQWLVQLSHSEDPWVNARAGLRDCDKCHREIRLEDMAMYYGGL